MNESLIPKGFADLVAPMRAAHERILADLRHHRIELAPPPHLPPARAQGIAAARAYPMQGVLKYHGLSDWAQRIAFLPSISINNAAAHTTTLVEFDPALPADSAVIGGAPAQGRELERVVTVLDAVRALAGITSHARVVSRNVVRTRVAGKGLGTSASAAAALACAAVGALFGPELAGHTRFLSTLARLLAGSGCRSAAGGLALWLSYPGIPPSESYAVRLDQDHELEDVALITVPIDSRVGLKTEQAHHDAPNSIFFRAWMLARGEEVRECIAAARRGDWQTIGQLAELDSMRLHGVTMSGSREQRIIGWEPENITLFRLCNDLRARGLPVYASTDTGPTVVFITRRDLAPSVIDAINDLGLGLETVIAPIGGPAHLIAVEEALRELA
ncbi:GHMP kinase, partial [Chloroflexus sp.]|uniref:diphosphomevalonate/mevalonate 3,5-bisphosphate decarboxylase family protein n=1 Tax=Chloroflexus sp. TaxID=1904827 RepID=UPI00298F3683